MAELMLTRDERLALRARAHHLNPVVLLGAAGLTDAVIKETDRALTAHELIKVRVPADDREQRAAIFAEIAGRLGAARVQSIGKLFVLYRPRPQEEQAADRETTKGRGRRASGASAKAGPTPRRAYAKPEKRPRASPAARRRDTRFR